MIARSAAAAACLALALGACSPGAPEGVDKTALDVAINDAIGDPGTCVLIGQGGKVVYRYGSNVTCGRKLPSCEGDGVRVLSDLLGSEPMTASCPSTADGSRSVAWSAGPVEGRAGVSYAAAMEGTATPPGLVITDKLKSAFGEAGLQPKS